MSEVESIGQQQEAGQHLGVDRIGYLKSLRREAAQLPAHMVWVEFVRNGIQAGGDVRVYVGDHSLAPSVVDDGVGMSGEEMRNYLGQTRKSGDDLVGMNQRHGVGARLAGIGMAPEGVTWVSRKNKTAHTMTMWQGRDGLPRVDGPWEYEGREILSHGKGTAVLFAGMDAPGSTTLQGILSRRWWTRDSEIRVSYRDGYSNRVQRLSESLENYARDLGSVRLSDKATARVWLLDERGPSDHLARCSGIYTRGCQAPRGGVGVVLDDGEVYECSEGSNARSRLRSKFGISAGAKRIWLLVFLDPDSGFEPSDNRASLVSTLKESRGGGIPWGKYGDVFQENMPPALREYIIQSCVGGDPDDMERLREFLCANSFASIGRRRIRKDPVVPRSGNAGTSAPRDSNVSTEPPGVSQSPGVFCPAEVLWISEEGPSDDPCWWTSSRRLTLNENHWRLSKLTEEVTSEFGETYGRWLARQAFKICCIDVMASARADKDPDPQPCDYVAALGRPTAMRTLVGKIAASNSIYRPKQNRVLA